MAEVFNYPGDIYCIVCDADIARNWAPLNPGKSRIKYLVPNSWTAERLKLYGVKKENIFLTGYPLPLENIGSEKMEILKKDLSHRLLNLDPERRYYQRYKNLVEQNIGNLPSEKYHILTLLFSIGGAGAQKEIVLEFIKSFVKEIKKEEIKIVISVGIRSEVRDYFINELRKLKLWNNLNFNIEIVFAQEIGEYFKKFNLALRETDVLWTKPSELSFYAGLGIPIIIAPTIGSQEDYNKKWLLRLGAGILQENPKYARQWFFDYLNSGRFAEAATHGFIEIEKLGVYNISKICFS
jgi:hypothetical protein